MFEDFKAIKEELGASFAAAFALLAPAVKLYIASINRRFSEMKAEIDKLEAEGDRRSKRLFESMEKVTTELHAMNLQITDKFLNLKAEIKVLQSQIINGRK